MFIYEHLTDVHDLKRAIVLVILRAVAEVYLAGRVAIIMLRKLHIFCLPILVQRRVLFKDRW